MWQVCHKLSVSGWLLCAHPLHRCVVSWYCVKRKNLPLTSNYEMRQHIPPIMHRRTWQPEQEKHALLWFPLHLCGLGPECLIPSFRAFPLSATQLITRWQRGILSLHAIRISMGKEGVLYDCDIKGPDCCLAAWDIGHAHSSMATIRFICHRGSCTHLCCEHPWCV